MKRGRGVAGIALAVTLAGTLAVLALAPFALLAGGRPALAQGVPAVCNTFPQLSQEAQKRGAAVSAAIKAKVDRKQICAMMNGFVPAEAAVVKFLVDNQTWCGIPAEAITASKANHEKSVKFRTMVCADEGPHAKPPSLSDAIKLSPLDTDKNTKAGSGSAGTFDTLTGNPLAR